MDSSSTPPESGAEWETGTQQQECVWCVTPSEFAKRCLSEWDMPGALLRRKITPAREPTDAAARSRSNNQPIDIVIAGNRPILLKNSMMIQVFQQNRPKAAIGTW